MLELFSWHGNRLALKNLSSASRSVQNRCILKFIRCSYFDLLHRLGQNTVQLARMYTSFPAEKFFFPFLFVFQCSFVLFCLFVVVFADVLMKYSLSFTQHVGFFQTQDED